MSWRPWEPIVRREVWRGRPWVAIPFFVISDEPQLLVTYVPEGAPFGFAEGNWPGGPHGWSHRPAWEGHGTLHLQRPGDPYAVFVFWRGPEREFDCWYVNFQDPFRRSEIGIDSHDHVVDLSSEDGRSWARKDFELLDVRVAEGRFAEPKAEEIRRDAERVEHALTEHGPWWDLAWADWTPPPGLEPPPLPASWERVPAA